MAAISCLERRTGASLCFDRVLILDGDDAAVGLVEWPDHSRAAFTTLCDMETDGGRWTILANNDNNRAYQQDGFGCGDNWSPKAHQGASSLMMVR